MNDVQIQGVIGVSVVVKPQTCVELFGEEDGEKRRKRVLGVPLVRGWGDTERADGEAGREWVKQERGVLTAK